MTDQSPYPEGGSVVDRLRAMHGAEVDPQVDLNADETLPGEKPAHDPEASSGVLQRLASHPTSSSRYRNRGEIARGGMGAILRVWDEDLRRHAAMKVAIMAGDEGSGTPASELDPRLLARFLEEAQVTG